MNNGRSVDQIWMRWPGSIIDALESGEYCMSWTQRLGASDSDEACIWSGWIGGLLSWEGALKASLKMWSESANGRNGRMRSKIGEGKHWIWMWPSGTRWRGTRWYIGMGVWCRHCKCRFRWQRQGIGWVVRWEWSWGREGVRLVDWLWWKRSIDGGWWGRVSMEQANTRGIQVWALRRKRAKHLGDRGYGWLKWTRRSLTTYPEWLSPVWRSEWAIAGLRTLGCVACIMPGLMWPK